MEENQAKSKLKAMKLLSKFIDRINEQDNRSTAAPIIFCVQSLETAFFAEDEYHADEVEPYQDEDEDDGSFKGYKHSNYTDKAWFFTEEGAKKHLRLNKHNYSSPRIYVKHCFRSPEIEDLLSAIATITDKKIERR